MLDERERQEGRELLEMPIITWHMLSLASSLTCPSYPSVTRKNRAYILEVCIIVSLKKTQPQTNHIPNDNITILLKKVLEVQRSIIM